MDAMRALVTVSRTQSCPTFRINWLNIATNKCCLVGVAGVLMQRVIWQAGWQQVVMHVRRVELPFIWKQHLAAYTFLLPAAAAAAAIS